MLAEMLLQVGVVARVCQDKHATTPGPEPAVADPSGRITPFPAGGNAWLLFRGVFFVTAACKSIAESLFFTQKELSVLLHRSLASLNRDRALALIPAPLKLGARVLWRRDEILGWIDAGMPPRNEWEARRVVPRNTKR